jgi:hypothetical protein
VQVFVIGHENDDESVFLFPYFAQYGIIKGITDEDIAAEIAAVRQGEQ